MVVMVIGALISGFNKGVSDMLEQSGPKTFWVGRHFQGGVSICDDTDENCPWRRNPAMKVEDARLIRQVSSVAFVAVDENAGAGSSVAYGARKTSSVDLSGRSADWVKVAGGDVYPGRSFTALEDAASSQVVVINQKLADWLFGHLDPIGRVVRIAGLPYTVIGVFNPPPSLFGEENNFQAFLPHGAFVKYVPYWKGWMSFLVGPTDSATTLQAMEDVTVALRVARGLRPGQENNFAVVSQEKFLESVNSTTLVLRVVMIVLSMVGLAVGGVGVVAIMMISVTERTREIGVRKALGARRREILWQFLVEAATLTLAGGVCGMIAGGVVALLIAPATPIRAHVPVGSIVAALAAPADTRRPRITYDDAQAVVQGVTTPVLTAWESSTRATLTAGRKQAKDVQVTAATEPFFDIRSLRIEEGRAFTPREVQAGVAVLVLGHELAEKLFGAQDPIGQEVKLYGIPYRVIGVVEKQGNLFGLSLDKFAVAPAAAPVKRYVNPPRVVDALAVKANSLPQMREAMLQAEAVMRSRRHLRPREPDDFALETADEVLDFWGKISRVLFVALQGLVAISLVVGGIVIMNIMLMAVAERTREIGIRKSLGARRRDILRQFLAV